MREYETAFIVQPEISDEGGAELCARLDGILESQGAVRLMLDDWGKRKLAYEIDKFQKGHYYFLSYLDDGKTVDELERALRLEESVLRFLTVRVADDVEDVETRKVEAAEKERIQREKAAERAAREAEAERASAEAAAAGHTREEGAEERESGRYEVGREQPGRGDGDRDREQPGRGDGDRDREQPGRGDGDRDRERRDADAGEEG